ncbi:MAG: electron transfer flavoprotein beta subunit [Candidatus Hydrogenedentes bacterium]|nr:electron transfer flavoprotein beta subunit [Candidatus Hydrogenedentota bacterium]
MKVAVLVKRVPDTASVLQIADDGKSVNTGGLKYVMSPYDEHAVEQAIKLKETHGGEVVVVSLGPPETKDIVRSALAMGADSGLLVTGDGISGLTNKGIALALSAAVKPLGADLILAGKQAVDDDGSQVPERVAELLGLPHVSVITRFDLNGTTATVDREIEGGHYTYDVPLPAVFTTQKGINTPRYPTLPNIMKAKKKPIVETGLAELGLGPDAMAAQLSVEALSLPRQKRLCRVIQGDSDERVRELVRVLRVEEKVL